MKKEAKSMKVRIDFGHMTATFTAGGRKRVLVTDDPYEGKIVYVNGEIVMADGTKAYAVLQFDELSYGEHWGTGVFVPGKGLVFDDEPDFHERLGKTREQYIPYKYKYSVQLHCHDHHVGDDGWSR